MKTRILFFLLLIVFSNSTKAQWVNEVSGFTPAGYSINDISVVNSNIVWATAYDTAGVAIVNQFTRTLNGGTTWTPDSVGGASTLDLTSISAYSKDTAWVSMVDNNLGGGAIYRTNDGGVSWTSQDTTIFIAPGGYPDFVYFFTKNIGVCVGDSNIGYWEIYTTVNGGTTWSRVPSANIPMNLPGETGSDNVYSVVGNTIWFGTSIGRIYKSTTMGTVWTVESPGLTTCSRLAFKDALNGIAADGTLLAQTTDGGTTWVPLSYTGNFYGTNLCYVPGTLGTYVSTGLSVGNNGSSYSIDDGATWTNIDTLGHDAVSFFNATAGWSGGANISSTLGGMYKWNGTFTGIKDYDYMKDVSMNVFPNPFAEQVTLSVNSEKMVLKNLNIEITDVLGNSILKRSDFVGNKIVIDRGNLVNGIYFYKVYNSDSIVGAGCLIAQ